MNFTIFYKNSCNRRHFKLFFTLQSKVKGMDMPESGFMLGTTTTVMGIVGIAELPHAGRLFAVLSFASQLLLAVVLMSSVARLLAKHLYRI